MGQKEDIKFLTILPNSDNEHLSLDMLNCIKRNIGKEKNIILEKLAIEENYKNQFISKCVKSGLLKIGDNENDQVVNFNLDKHYFLGIGFNGNKCYLTLLNMKNELIKEDILALDIYVKPKMKTDEIESIIKILKKTSIEKNLINTVCIAVSDYLLGESKNLGQITAGISKIFGLSVRVVKHATACAYADKESMKNIDTEILYMYSDVGTGVVLKKELIFEATNSTAVEGGEYLRPWNQYSMVAAAKDFVSKGVGTEIVHIVGGNLEKINTEIVLEAASKGDELSCDLVRRSGLALGLRVAYLIDLFNVKTVVFGGDIKEGEAVFIDTVKESMGKFLDSGLIKQVKLIPGVLGKEASSFGAASLSRRQIFMEV
ncbi:MAG: ROK family protein [Candidatus Omnitrophica bacterium]|nr:ROK family protein [Candidatus Omnitrophota bacterium]